MPTLTSTSLEPLRCPWIYLCWDTENDLSTPPIHGSSVYTLTVHPICGSLAKKLKCPDADSLSSFEAAVQRGDITWHAGPMNMEFEMLDSSMMEFSIQLSIDLDKRFNISRSHRTVSQRDVPGTTQAILPILHKMGVKALSIGVNGATTPAALPPVFMWRYMNTSLMTLYHPGGYPNSYGPSPLKPGGLSRKDCAVAPTLSHALCFAFRSDNQGPPETYKEVIAAYEIARAQFPKAFVQASTFDQVVALFEKKSFLLPVVLEEIGDVWIQGAGSDPRKTAELRALYRARASCLAAGHCSLSDPRVYNASRFMLKLSEHTWGAAGNCVDLIHWTNDQLQKMLSIPDGLFINATYFWDEQRNFSDLALEALGDHPLGVMARKEIAQTRAQPISYDGFNTVDPSDLLQCGGFLIQFDKQGSLIRLKDDDGKEWASPAHPLGTFVYQTYNQTDFDRFDNATTPYSLHFFLGIGKPNMSKNASPESRIWKTKVDSLMQNKDKSEVIVQISMADKQTRSYYGAPEKVFVKYTCVKGLDVIVQWENKVATRLPESLSFVFTPIPQAKYKWWLHKIDTLIDPLNVVVNGSQRLHAINKGVYYIDTKVRGLEITSPDAAVVNILTDQDYISYLPLPLSKIQSITGVAFDLYNNLWETNYIFWYPYKPEDTNQRFRFSLRMK